LRLSALIRFNDRVAMGVDLRANAEARLTVPAVPRWVPLTISIWPGGCGTTDQRCNFALEIGQRSKCGQPLAGP